MKTIFLKNYSVIKANGIIFYLKFLFKTIYFRFYSRKFKSSRRVFLKKGYIVSGHKYISLGNNFRAGLSLRLEAISCFAEQRFDPVVTIGDNVFINDYVHIGCINNIKIGNNVLFASKIFITDHNHGYYGKNDTDQHESPEIPPANRLLSNNTSVIIEDNVWLGEAVSVLPGSHIGQGSIIGANSVVRGVIPAFSIAVGSPAVVVKEYCPIDRVWKSVNNTKT